MQGPLYCFGAPSFSLTVSFHLLFPSFFRRRLTAQVNERLQSFRRPCHDYPPQPQESSTADGGLPRGGGGTEENISLLKHRFRSFLAPDCAQNLDDVTWEKFTSTSVHIGEVHRWRRLDHGMSETTVEEADHLSRCR